MREHILKKKTQRTNTIQILWIVKNQEKANNSPSYRCAAINNNILSNFCYQVLQKKFIFWAQKCTLKLNRS